MHGLYLEDLYVQPAHRGAGLGRALLARLAAVCAERGLGRLEWSVLDWNAPSIGFYRALGAVAMDEWTVFRLDGDALAALGRTGLSAATRTGQRGASEPSGSTPIDHEPGAFVDQQHERREHQDADGQAEHDLARRPDQRVDDRQEQELGDQRGRARPVPPGQEAKGDRPERHHHEQEEPGLAEHRADPDGRRPGPRDQRRREHRRGERLHADQDPGRAHRGRRCTARRRPRDGMRPVLVLSASHGSRIGRGRPVHRRISAGLRVGGGPQDTH